MSKFHFLRVFRSVTGKTPIEYRNACRIAYAKTLLCDTDITVTEIAERFAYASPAYFSDAFRRATGISPVAYRHGKGTPSAK